MKKKLSLVLATLMLLGLLAGCGGQPAASGDKAICKKDRSRS